MTTNNNDVKINLSGLYNLDPLDTQTITIDTSASPYTISGLTGSTYYTSANWNPPSVNLSHEGIKLDSSADLIMGDVSLKEFMKKIEQRLAILTPNPELEKEFAELKALGDQYRELEQFIKDKMKTWDILKRED